MGLDRIVDVNGMREGTLFKHKLKEDPEKAAQEMLEEIQKSSTVKLVVERRESNRRCYDVYKRDGPSFKNTRDIYKSKDQQTRVLQFNRHCFGISYAHTSYTNGRKALDSTV